MSGTARPIIFSGEMVRAILEGRKTQTRRLMKYQPLDVLPMKVPDAWVTLETRNPNHGKVIGCRYGKAGDRLWVREAAYIAPPNFGDPVDANCKDYDKRPRFVGWAASMDGESVRCATDYGVKLSSPIHLPRWACRLVLEITAVRLERLQAIKEKGARAEGVPAEEQYTANPMGAYYKFRYLWDAINGKRAPWDSNPYVWVIEFKRVLP